MDKPTLILGTAEFNPDGYAGKPCPDKIEIVRILALAWEAGIRTLDTADSYNCPDLFTGFELIRKNRIPDDPTSYYHYQATEPRQVGVRRASVYTVEQSEGLTHAIFPFNINNTRLKFILSDVFFQRRYIRSVFDRGRLLEEGFTVKDCLDFVKRRPVDGIIVGVNSVRELEDILNVY